MKTDNEVKNVSEATPPSSRMPINTESPDSSIGQSFIEKAERSSERQVNRKNGRMKVDRLIVHRLRREGRSYGDIAKQLKVSKNTVWQACRQMDVQVVRAASLEAGHRVLQDHLDAVTQLRKINENVNFLLDGIMRELINPGRQESAKGLRDTALKCSQEIRGQLAMQAELFKLLTDAQVVMDFQQEVLEAIGEESAECRNRIIDRLKAKHALRASLQFRP